MKTNKSRQGGAYLMVLATTMIIMVMVSIVFTVTAFSMRISSYYTDFVGLYDLAISGNEQGLVMMREHISAHQDTISERAWARIFGEGFIGVEYAGGALRLDYFTRNRYRHIYIQEAMVHLRNSLSEIFTPYGASFRFNWGLNITIDTAEHVLTDTYRAITTITASGNRYNINTAIHSRYIEGSIRIASTVQASIIWAAYGYREIILDVYTIEVLEAMGTIFPFIPAEGEYLTLILDEFTFAMVESLRI